MLAALQDFPDRVSPMVVKELRQGLRTRQFAMVMLTLHALLVLLTLMAGGAQNAEGIGQFMNGIITLVLCLILPLRGFSALADEIKKNTLDTLVLTRLSAGRIVFGKWASLASQATLVALSILPYVVARYVFGGLELASEIAALGGKWLAGLCITAGIVALSTVRLAWLRGIMVGVLALGPLMGVVTLWLVPFSSGGTRFFVMGSASTFGSPLLLAFMALAAAAWLTFSLLSMAATRIAPAASNLAVVKRTVHFAALVIAAGVIAFVGAPALVWAGALGLVTMLASLDALTEQTNDVPSVYAAFYQRGWLGRLASWFLAPGWPSGLFFSLLMALVSAAVARAFGGQEEAAAIWLAAASVWMPAALVQLSTLRRAGDLFAPWLGAWLICVILGRLLSLTAISFTMQSQTPWPSCLLPGTAVTGLAVAQAGDKATFLAYSLAAASVWPLLLLVLLIPPLLRTRAVRREALAMAAADRATST